MNATTLRTIAASAAFAVSGTSLSANAENDAYLESTGESGLNARMVIGADIRAEVDFAFTDTTPQQRVFGWNSRPSFYISGDNDFTFGVGPDPNWFYHATTIPADTNRHTAVLDYFNRKLEIHTDGVVSWSADIAADRDITPAADKPTPVALFANAEDGTYTGLKFKHQAKIRIYRARFFRSGIPVHDYIPCVKGDVPGMLDRLDGAFVCGENVDTFRVGGDVMRIPDDGYVELTGNNQESGSKKWIDTGYAPGPGTRLVFDYALATNYVAAASSGEWWYLGCYTPASGSAPAERMNFAANGSSLFRWRTGSDDFSVANADIAGPRTQRGIRRRIVYDSSTKTYSIVTAGYTNFTAVAATSLSRRFERTLRIGCNTDEIPRCYAPLRIYGLKIFEGGTLLHDYLPVVTNGVPGLLDVQTGEFKANAEANTPLLGCSGAIEADASSKAAFIEFTGAQSIDTEIVPTKDTAVIADFQFTSTTNSPQQFVLSSDEMCMRLYTASSPKNFSWFCHNSTAGGVDSGIPLDTFRLTVTLDGFNETAEFVRDGKSIYSYAGAWKANGNTCTSTMRIGSRFAEGANGWNFARMKLYGCKVYEAGTLVRDYVPCMRNGVVGLLDRKNATFAADEIGTTPLKIGGVGDIVQPLDDISVSFGKTVVIDGTTSGAVGYQWFVNDSPVEGATDATIAIDWRGGNPDTDTLRLVPYFDMFGVWTAGDSSSTTVTYIKPATMIVFR